MAAQNLGVKPFTPGSGAFGESPGNVEALPRVRVVVERQVDSAEDGGAELPSACVLLRSVRVLQRLRSSDGRRELWILEAPDAELVREVMRQVWPDAPLRVWTACPIDRTR